MNVLTMLALSLSLAQAPEAAAPAAKLTLEEALATAERRNLDLKAVEAALRQADEISAAAWSFQLPQVTASGTALWNKDDSVIPAGVLGPDPVVVVPFDQQSAKLEVTQVLLAPSLWFSIRQAHRGEDAAVANLEGGRSAVRFGVAQAFFGVAALGKAVSVNERLLEIAQRQEKDARVRFQAGTIAKVGLLRAEIERARAEQDLKRARNAYESARLTLATLLDRAADFEVVEPAELPSVGAPAELEARALRDRRDVTAARATVDANRAERNAALAQYLPTVAAFWQHNWSSTGGLTGQGQTEIMGLSASWTLLDGGLRESKIRTGNARVAEAEARLQKAERVARDEVRQALLDLDSARANAEKAREQRELAAENQRLVDVSYKAGAATAVEQADATAQLRTAEFALQAEELGARIAALRVAQVVGADSPLPR